MKVTERAEEILESLWVRTMEENQKSTELGTGKGDPAIDELIGLGYIKKSDQKISLTEKGRSEGEKIIRRHRLAERLFTDVLDIRKKLVHSVSCQLEHLLQEGIEDNICILLGHPTTCPHGKPIPPGECCRKSRETTGKVVSALADLQPNQKGKVAYVQVRDDKKLQKLMAMGVLPGMSIMLIQRFPSFVFQLGQSQFAVDKELAQSIYVRMRKG